MSKHMVLYNSSASARELMANASPEEMQGSMAEWLAWRDEASKTFKVEFGLPLQAVNQVTTDGVTESDNQTNGYSTFEGDSKDALLELLLSHPHLKRASASIDLFEMMPMPGM